jgi:uncharacterized protein (TIGR02453 family)
MDNQYLKFLETLSQNNNKTWMDANRDWYLKIRESLLADVEIILQGITQWEPELSSFKAKDCVFRQNRDVRFSANKDPYKTNLAAYFSVGGRNRQVLDITFIYSLAKVLSQVEYGCLPQMY